MILVSLVYSKNKKTQSSKTCFCLNNQLIYKHDSQNKNNFYGHAEICRSRFTSFIRKP